MSSTPADDLIALASDMASKIQAKNDGVERFVEPQPGDLSKALTPRHNLVFGRRGTGKSSLMMKAMNDLADRGHPVSAVTLQPYKSQAYPDAVASIVVKMLTGFRNCLAKIPSADDGQGLFLRITRRRSYKRSLGKTVSLIETELASLASLKAEVNGAQIKSNQQVQTEQSNSSKLGGKIKSGPAEMEAGVGADSAKKTTSDVEEQYQRSKVDSLNARIYGLRDIVGNIGKLAGKDAYFFVDDLHHLQRKSQVRVLDFLHNIAKSNGLWLKIGTNRHRSVWYERGDPPIGMQLGDDADPINLDLSLDMYPQVRYYLVSILESFARENGIETVASFMTDTAIDRLVMASGGVPRDFISICAKAIRHAVNRWDQDGHRIWTTDVNQAAIQFCQDTKMQHFEQDTDKIERGELLRQLNDVREFCWKKKASWVLVGETSSERSTALIRELADLKFLHLLHRRVTVGGERTRLWHAYQLDLSQWVGDRMPKNIATMDIRKGASRRRLGRKSLIYQQP